MDPVQMGRFLALLRKEAGLTQEALGQTLGVTNKTVSRWENGNYLPDLEMLQLLGARFGVSVDELIQGRRGSGQTAQAAPERAKAERTVPEQTITKQTAPEQTGGIQTASERSTAPERAASEQADAMQKAPERSVPDQPDPDSTAPSSERFALQERIAYWKQKWLREHIPALILYYVLLCILLPVAASALELAGNAPFLAGGWSLLTLVFYITARNRMMIYVEARAFLP